MNEQSELEDAIVVAGSKKQPFVVSYSEFNGRKLLDVRKYYLDKKTGETKPTRKGVSLNRLQFEVLHNVFKEKCEEIEDWFELEETERSAEIQAVTNAKLSSPRATVEFTSWVGLEMFRYRRSGGAAVLQLNTRHPWVDEFYIQYQLEGSERNKALDMTIGLLDSFFCSVALLDPKNESANEVMETVLGNWGIFAKRRDSEG